MTKIGKTIARKPNAALMKPVQPDDALAVIVGSTPLPRGELTKKLWDYIKKNKLQDELAQRRGPNIIGIILSGSGSDGGKGIQAIKKADGITFAEDEKSARFFGMPSTAIQTGCVDFVLVPGRMAQELIRIGQRVKR